MFSWFKKKPEPVQQQVSYPIIYISCKDDFYSFDWILPEPQNLTKKMADNLGRLISHSGRLGIVLSLKIRDFCLANDIEEFWVDIEHAADRADVDMEDEPMIPAGEAFRKQ